MERKEEIELFTKSYQLAIDEFYFDSIESFKLFNEKFSKSELIDDSLYNIGLCYFELNQIENAIKYFDIVIDDYPESTISVLNGGNEYGKTPAKCYYSKINCYLKQNNISQAENMLNFLQNFKDSYVVYKENERLTFYEMGVKSINKYKEITGN